MSKNRKSKAPSNYITTIRDQTNKAIAANIFRGNTPDGHCYLYFEISRSWKAQSSNREGYSNRFYGRHAEAISRVALTDSCVGGVLRRITFAVCCVGDRWQQ